ncbi:MAG: helicase-exonuclease AddAB subunit AddA [Clostridia bacterium]|nr:helicase-exonuclease AddAB subunit AddA [Clostridia bacterium]
MADVKWTDEQKDAIYDSGSNILVAAAAGSGKTAVLVERIINKVINENVDIDKILVVTFTNAAASEMRERILEAIYKKMEEFPDNKNLQRQIILINKASICTIDSFCLDVIRNNFFEIDVSANFRVADTTEIELLKQEVIDDIFEDKYLNKDEEFLRLINTYTTYRDDEPLKELLLNIYRYIQSSPFPEQWLHESVEKFNLKDGGDFANTKWGQILLQALKEDIYDYIVNLKKIEQDLLKYDELVKYKIVIGEDIVNLEYVYENLNSWDNAYEKANALTWAKWPTDRKITMELKDKAKEVRDSIKKKFDSSVGEILLYNSAEANENIYNMYDILRAIEHIIIEFSKKFAQSKKEKNIVDFNDIEHFALKILVKRNEDGSIEETDIAKKYKEKFAEIAIDEYQDSNYVQEYILTSVSNGHNVFMVGDVKQSIYKFRQACPNLFLEKYDRYNLKNGDTSNGQKIQLFKNFRSRSNILDVTNIIFEDIMSKRLGDIKYDKTEFLNLGADYVEPVNPDLTDYAGKTELHIIDLKEPEINVFKGSEDDENEDTLNQDRIEDVVLEARFTAQKIKELLDSDYMVYDRKAKDYRHVTYKDIALLLRATSVTAPIYENEIAKLNIPVFSDVSSEYLESMEIQTIMSVLKIIDNPMQDIPLVTVLRSAIAGFTDNELVQIRLKNKKQSFYNSLKEYDGDDKLKSKITLFLSNIKRWQAQEKYMPLDELIWQIYIDTGFYNYVTLMPNGALRQANLKMLFERAKQYESASFKGLFNFISFIDKLHTSSGDLSSAKLIGENENVVRIMSIHKSKGLEFPVVYLCGTGKQFNMQDLNKNILLHQELGIGPKYINNERCIEYNTLAKEAIKIQTKIESLSEEMRVLYVALTRAKEKLIITGISKDSDKSFKEKQELLETYKKIDCNGINESILKRYKSYLDWITLVYFNNTNTIKDYIELEVHKKQDLLTEFEKSKQKIKERNIIKELSEKSRNIKTEDVQALKNKINWLYGYMDSVVIPTKTSVTKVKELANSEAANAAIAEFDDLDSIVSLEELEQSKAKEVKQEMAKPKFLNEEVEQKLTSAQKGTIMHLCFQRLDHTRAYDWESIKAFVQEMVDKNIITKLEADSINIKKLVEYTKSGLWQELKNAKKVYKEQPFYINLKAKDIYENSSDDNVLVQGIIDLFYINQNDEIILVDYKTDWVQEGEELQLVNKYSRQLEIYQQALENALGRKVNRKYIYSVNLNKMILG